MKPEYEVSGWLLALMIVIVLLTLAVTANGQEPNIRTKVVVAGGHPSWAWHHQSYAGHHSYGRQIASDGRASTKSPKLKAGSKKPAN